MPFFLHKSLSVQMLDSSASNVKVLFCPGNAERWEFAWEVLFLGSQRHKGIFILSTSLPLLAIQSTHSLIYCGTLRYLESVVLSSRALGMALGREVSSYRVPEWSQYSVPLHLNSAICFLWLKAYMVPPSLIFPEF